MNLEETIDRLIEIGVAWALFTFGLAALSIAVCAMKNTFWS